MNTKLWISSFLIFLILGILKPGMMDVVHGKTIADIWSSSIPGGPGTPIIEFTYIPPYGSRTDRYLRGRVLHVNPDDYKVAVYIYVSGWWTKPYWSRPLTYIAADGRWSCNVYTGGYDYRATKFAAYVVPNGYFPPSLGRSKTLPPELEANAVAVVQATRTKGVTIRVTSPNGGENFTVASTRKITWTSSGSVGAVKIEYSHDNMANWITIVSSTKNIGSYSWNVPDTPSETAYIRISETDISPSDISDAPFTIATPPAITLMKPNGGENLAGFSNQLITWTSKGSVGNVKISYSTDNGVAWNTIASSTANDGSHTWTVPNISSTKSLVKVSEIDGLPFDTSNAVFSIYEVQEPPQIALSLTQLNYGATGNVVTRTQTVLITNSNNGTLNWSTASSQPWLLVSPASGSGDGELSVSLDISKVASTSAESTGALAPRLSSNYSAAITVSDPNAENSPQLINVNLIIYDVGETLPPFGEFATPLHGSTVFSSIPVTGWVLDDMGIESVNIYRGDGTNLVYIGSAAFVQGARPDVWSAYPSYPLNFQAGWGYMMLTNFLPNKGNGTFKIHAIATDLEGNQVSLGTKTIQCDNLNAVKPFGAIDTPAQGGNASGNQFVNWGWTLTPQPNSIPTNGSTISVYVDGISRGHPVYNKYREDIASFFPGYANSNGAVGYFYLDTTNFSTGVHTIQWIATDDAGNTDGIGSRYFTIKNFGLRQSQLTPFPLTGEKDIFPPPISYDRSIRVKRGYNRNIPPQILNPDNNGIIKVRIRELERLEIHLRQAQVKGYSLIGDQLKSLPVGSYLDTGRGIFYWLPGSGFYGTYNFVFIYTGGDYKDRLQVEILPKNSEFTSPVYTIEKLEPKR